MEVEDFGGNEARVRLSLNEISELAKLALSSENPNLAVSFAELESDIRASTENGRLKLMRPVPYRRETVGNMLGPKKTKEMIAERKELSPKGLSKKTINQIRRGRR